ncbi:hypothetical protein BU23DRAFT_584262 [Bimuria novae-zelandiae CBS 107.79]|uniref:Nudix hydrolase domain-containing protein n=1 Tax=Bimuria novae-zelandiae CBS 107.79 TaxID=1447943 RepID=A0A6A5UPC2_9PLEO|nr:hypothetical protein BU23DRAFT_584262 [Bimuria novae-zelandiae CBS 107.79]
MSSAADHTPLNKAPRTLPVPIPSSSVVLVSPTNQVLLLHRVRTASAFSSAHVFPGGALSPEHDGPTPPITDTDPHHSAYKLAAIRETFEESGILLAKKNGRLFTEISEAEREKGRRAVHAGTTLFPDLLKKWGCQADVDALIPFTRWITPANVKKRFSTQMYLYFLPLNSASPPTNSKPKPISSGEASVMDGEDLEGGPDIVIPHPTHDGGIEHTAARFLPPNKWLELAAQNRIILFPPQYFLTWHLSHYLSRTVTSSSLPIPAVEELQRERDSLMGFLAEDDGAVGKAVISPVVLGGLYGEKEQGKVGRELEEGIAVLKLDSAGAELEEVGVRGSRVVGRWVITTKFKKEGPRDVRVRERGDVLGEEGRETKL